MLLEKARLGFMCGVLGEEMASTLNDLSRLLEGESMEDTRSWELLPEIGGKRLSTREITCLGDEITPQWARVFGSVILGFVRCLATGSDIERAGEMALISEEDLDVVSVLFPMAPGLTVCKLLPVERSFIRGVLSISKTLSGGSTSDDESAYGLQVAVEGPP
jgi:hypothetical protein